ncbi:MAG: hypothetical protein AAF553_09285 [Pseudomonadota bacterium]
MDTLRGHFESDGSGARASFEDDHDFGLDAEGDECARNTPPAGIGQDERRMQVRAYNHWASLLGERTYPSIEDLEPEHLPDFGPYSVLLDFSSGIEDPMVQFLGAELAEECGAPGRIDRLSDVPPRSLLSRITDHYLQIMANEAPIGFEAEFVNQRGVAILYRGILLPFSSDDETIDFIYGVINWKEMADAATADELLLEIDQALENSEDGSSAPHRHHADTISDWADSPAHEAGEEEDFKAAGDENSDNVADFDAHHDGDEGYGDASQDSELPMPDFGQYELEGPEGEDEDDGASYSFASLADYIEAPAKKAVDLDADKFDPADYRVEETPKHTTDRAPLPQAYEPAEPKEPEFTELADDANLQDWLASAREYARSASASEERSRHALYAAVSRAYDFSIIAQGAPEEYHALMEESGLTVQERAPMTPVVKLVFGSDYDKTRLTEYAAVLSHAHRMEIERGALVDFLTDAEGGLKGVVNAERRLRKEESGKPVEKEERALREALAEKLRELEALTVDAISNEGPEFALVMVRRNENGVEIVGEVDEDIGLIERAARKLVG